MGKESSQQGAGKGVRGQEILKSVNGLVGGGSGWCGALAILEGLHSSAEVCGTNQINLASKLFQNYPFLRAHRNSTLGVEGGKADWIATGILGEVSV